MGVYAPIFKIFVSTLFPFLVAALIFWLPVATGRAAQLEIEAKTS